MNCCGNKKGIKIMSVLLLVLAASAVYYLWTRHEAHVAQLLPIGILLLCPLMHLFGGHGGHDHQKKEG